MPNPYNGNTSGLSGRPTVTISEPVGTDTRNALSVQTPFRKLADLVQYLMANAAFLGANVFTATQQISSGALELTQAAAQAILKAGSGKLQVGTKAGNNSDLELLINGVVKAILRASDGKLQGQSTAPGDAGTTLASKDYADARETAAKAHTDTLESEIASGVAKAWAFAQWGSGWTIAASRNIASIALVSGTTHRVTFAAPMPDTNYVIGSAPEFNPRLLQVKARTVNSFDFDVYDYVNNATVNPNVIQFVVFR
jgi:hypothetical protein